MNALLAVEDQSPPSEKVLRAIGQIFTSHGVNEDVGVSLLHKHLLEDEAVVVHDGLRCSPTFPKASGENLSGCSFFCTMAYFNIFLCTDRLLGSFHAYLKRYG